LREKSFNLLLTWHRAILPGSDPPSIFAIVTFNNRVRDGSEWFHYTISTRKALKTLNPVSAFSLMRCISFAQLNYITKLSPVCQPLCEKFFFDDVMESDEGRETGFLMKIFRCRRQIPKKPGFWESERVSPITNPKKQHRFPALGESCRPLQTTPQPA
jgi:hypothetical protein